MTATTAPPEKKSLGLASTALETATTNESIKGAFSLLFQTYVKISETTKYVLPVVLSSKLDAVETYVSSVDKESVAHAIDGTVDSVYFFGSDAVAAKKDKKLATFLADKVLTVAEDYVAPEEKQKKESDPTLTPSSSSSRLVSLSGNVSKKVIRKASEGVVQLRDRVVPADLVTRANDFIDHQVKPQVTFVASIPSSVAEKVNETTASVTKGVNVVYDELNTRVFDVATNVITTNKNEPDLVKGKLLFSAFLGQLRLAWNDFFVVPVSNYLSLPDLKPSTLYHAALASKQYLAVRTYTSSVFNHVSEKVAYIYSFPAALLDKTVIEVRERYLEFTGKEFTTSTAIPAVYEATKSRVYVGLLTIQDYSKVLVKKSVNVLARYLPARVVKAITSGPLRVIEATEEVIEGN